MKRLFLSMMAILFAVSIVYGATHTATYNGSSVKEYVFKCDSGGQVSVFLNGNDITVFGAGTLSTTTHVHSVQSAADKACGD